MPPVFPSSYDQRGPSARRERGAGAGGVTLWATVDVCVISHCVLLVSPGTVPGSLLITCVGRDATQADEAYNIGPAASAESYLRADKIIDVAKRTGADGIHPGYGFLSENADFANALEAEGIEFVGPPASAITSMGDKIMSMRIAEEAGVSCAKRFDGEVDSVDRAVELATGIGYPIIMKASAGGGGKGMRIAWTEAELIEGFTEARAEAATSFGDDRALSQPPLPCLPWRISAGVVSPSAGPTPSPSAGPIAVGSTPPEMRPG